MPRSRFRACWRGRVGKTDGTFASQWYAVAALFLFPWMLCAAQAVLLWWPVRGTVQAIAAGWYAQGAWSLWLAPLALTGAYYIVPKVAGRVLPTYESAPLGFWTLILSAPGRVAVISSADRCRRGFRPSRSSRPALQLFHYLVVAAEFSPGVPATVGPRSSSSASASSLICWSELSAIPHRVSGRGGRDAVHVSHRRRLSSSAFTAASR